MLLQKFDVQHLIVPQAAKHPCRYRHRGLLVKRMAKQLSQYTVISQAENVTTLYCVLSVCQRGHSNPWSQQHHHSWRSQCDPCLWQHHCSWWCLRRTESSKRMGLFVHQYVPTQCNQLQEVAKPRGNATPITTKPDSSVPWEEQPRPATETTLTRSLRQLNGGAKHPIDLRARKSFEHDGCSEWVFSASLASDASDASGEVGSQQGWSVLGPSRDMCERNPQPGKRKRKPRKLQSFFGVFGFKKL